MAIADYYIDNANTSIVYAMPTSESGQPWQTFSVGTQSLALRLSNSTGNYTITLDASDCYDQNYALGVCGTGGGCFVQVPFTGSGITMYVFNAGASGMAASFSVDGGAAVSRKINGPTAAENYQLSHVSMYDIQGLLTGNHTIQMTLLDWKGGNTSMKFDYAHVNETFVAAPNQTTASVTSTSQTVSTRTPSPTSAGNPSASKKTNVGAAVGATLGGVAVLGVIVTIAFFYIRKRRASPQEEVAPESTFQIDPFTSESLSSSSDSRPYAQGSSFLQHPEGVSNILPYTRSATLHDTHAGGGRPSEPILGSRSTASGMNWYDLQPIRRQPSYGRDIPSNISHLADEESSFSVLTLASRYNLTPEQVEVIRQLRADNTAAETVAHVIEGFVSSRLSAEETPENGQIPKREGNVFSSVPPPNYQTRDR